MKRIELNLDKKNVAAFIDWLANDGYWGHTLNDYDVEHGSERVVFVINGHELSNYSNQHHSVVIDGGYVRADNFVTYIKDGVEYSPIDYCLKKLGYE